MSIVDAHGQGSAIEVSYNNFLYKGINNQLIIAAENRSNDNLEFEVSHGKIFFEEGCYYYNTDSLGHSIINVYRRKRRKLIPIGTHSFRIKEIPKPVFELLGYQHNDSISSDRLKICEVVNAKLYRFDPSDIYYNIDSFRVTIHEKKFSEPKIFINKSKLLSEELKKAIRDLQPGSKMEFDRIYARIIGDDRKIVTDRSVLVLDAATFFVK